MHKKIVVIGTSGAGKTTFGQEIAQALAIKCIDLDELYWLPGWKEREDTDFSERLQAGLKSEAWVVCGNYSRAHPLIWPQAEAIIWLDPPLRICLFRALKRSLQRIFSKQTICNGNIETWGRFLSKKSILRWIWNTYPQRKQKYAELFAQNQNGCKTYRFTTERQKRQFLHSLKSYSTTEISTFILGNEGS